MNDDHNSDITAEAVTFSHISQLKAAWLSETQRANASEEENARLEAEVKELCENIATCSKLLDIEATTAYMSMICSVQRNNPHNVLRELRNVLPRVDGELMDAVCMVQSGTSWNMLTSYSQWQDVHRFCSDQFDIFASEPEPGTSTLSIERLLSLEYYRVLSKNECVIHE